ncbi:hypothetical protein [Rhodanobacter sp. OR92]|uniref:hypothetical protein n=1 Tax=Rhodanobacter sp. OR92 TaxID=1076524 RepID=UPI0003F81F0C|nr:hypothetical protein [Rhodanobacter sp. OR92]
MPLKSVDTSSPDFLDFVATQIDLHSTAIAMLMGKTKALEYAVDVLIAAHPDRAEMHDKWQAVAPELIDSEMGKSIFDEQAYRQTFQVTMASLSRLIGQGFDGQ